MTTQLLFKRTNHLLPQKQVEKKTKQQNLIQRAVSVKPKITKVTNKNGQQIKHNIKLNQQFSNYLLETIKNNKQIKKSKISVISPTPSNYQQKSQLSNKPSQYYKLQQNKCQNHNQVNIKALKQQVNINFNINMQPQNSIKQNHRTTQQHDTNKQQQQTKINKILESQKQNIINQSQQQILTYKQVSRKLTILFKQELNITSIQQLDSFLSTKINFSSLFFDSRIIKPSQQKWIQETVNKYTNKLVKRSELIYRWDKLNTCYFKYLSQNVRNFIIVFKGQNGGQFGAFVEKVCQINSDKYGAFLFCLKSLKEPFGFTKKLQQQKTYSNYWLQGRLFWTFGNTQLRLKDSSKQIKIFPNPNQQYYKIGHIQNLIGVPSRDPSTFILENLEIYKMIFD